VKFALEVESFGADGITIHPRPDQRHATYQDVFDLKSAISTELNVEGNPTKDFMDVVLKAKPSQVTLVPDAPNAITSNAGWDTLKHQSFLLEICSELKRNDIRTSIFLDPNPFLVDAAKKCDADRIELYTENYAKNYKSNKVSAIADYSKTALEAHKIGLEVNAGHDLNLENLKHLKDQIPYLAEVSIGHALVVDCLYLGLENTIRLYKNQLK
jgi:pyridoxine 5-phosphate synthase